MNFNLSSLLYHDREWFVFQEVLSRFPKDKATALQQRLMSSQKDGRFTSRLGISRDWVIGNRKTKLMERHFIEDQDQGRDLIFSGVLISSENFEKLLHDFFFIKVTIIIEQFTLTEKLFASDTFQWYYDPSKSVPITKVKIVHGKRVPTEEVHGNRIATEVVQDPETEKDFLAKKIRTTKKRTPKRPHSVELVSDATINIDSSMNTSGSESVVRSRRKKARVALQLISEITKDENGCNCDDESDEISIKKEPISPGHFTTNNIESEVDTVISTEVDPYHHSSHYGELSMAPCSPEVAPFPYGADHYASTSHSPQLDYHSTGNLYPQVEHNIDMVKTEPNSGEQSKGLVTPADSTSDNIQLGVSPNLNGPSSDYVTSAIMANIKEQQDQLFTEIEDTDSLSAVDESEGNSSNGSNSEYGSSQTSPCISNKEQATTNYLDCDGDKMGESAPEKVDNKAADLLKGLIATGFVPQVRQLLENVKNSGSQTKADQLEQDIRNIKSRIRQRKKSNQQLQVNIKKKAKELEDLFDNLKKGKDQYEELERECKKLESEKIEVEEQVKKCLDVLNSLS